MTKAHERLLEQLDRLPLDLKLKSLVVEGVNSMSPEDALRSAADLKAALDRLPVALDTLRKSDGV